MNYTIQIFEITTDFVPQDIIYFLNYLIITFIPFIILYVKGRWFFSINIYFASSVLNIL